MAFVYTIWKAFNYDLYDDAKAKQAISYMVLYASENEFRKERFEFNFLESMSTPLLGKKNNAAS